MYRIDCDVAVVGAGPAGLAAAAAAKKEGAEKVLVIERDERIGGILQQCIHPGFGLSYFQSELTGPEYAGRFEEEAKKLGVSFLMKSMVLEVHPQRRKLYCVSAEHGITEVCAKSIVLSMGCRERTRANLMIPGSRPAGIYTAGAAQRLINRQNAVVGKNIVILGSGDIGMIMARRMTLEGAKVLAVVEIMDYLAGLTRNKVQCLDDFDIPLMLSRTVTRIVGNERIEGVWIAQVDGSKKPIVETEQFVACDTLLLSVGLIPENELTKEAGIEMDPGTNGPKVNQYRQTSQKPVFACGNVVHVNDLVDNVTAESLTAGASAARFAMGKLPEAHQTVKTVPGENVRYLCPQQVALDGENAAFKLFFRVLSPQNDVVITAKAGEKELIHVRKQRVNPGEMEFVELSAENLADDIVVQVVKEGR